MRSVALNGNQGAALGHILGEVGITNTLDDRGIVGVGIQGYASFGHASGDLGNLDNNYQLDDGMNYVRGSHNLQFGGSIRYHRTWQQNANAVGRGPSDVSARADRAAHHQRAGADGAAGQYRR